jgi:hypothetical protein
MASRVPPHVQLSVVIPVYNEEPSLDELHTRLSHVLVGLGLSYEIIFVDDGSTDGSYLTLSTLSASDPAIRIVKLARNYGQTAALAAGFDHAQGEVIVAMDSDLQHAPEDLPKLLAKLAEGYDIASGWRANRVDGYWTRRLPSRIANWMMAKLSGVSLHDFGTTFKAYRAPVIKRIRLHGDLHRFIPALASWGGARIAEVPIANIPRPQNQSHYGLSRTWRVAADLLTVRFLLRYVTRPLHFFGPIGFASVAAGGVGGAWVMTTKLLTGTPVFLSHGPLLLLSAVLVQTGMTLIGLGLLAELMTRIYMDGRERRIYTLAQDEPRRDRAWSGPRPVPAPVRSGMLQ